MRKAHMLTLGALVAVAVAIALAAQPGTALADSAAGQPGRLGGFWLFVVIAVCAIIFLIVVVIVCALLGTYMARRHGNRPG